MRSSWIFSALVLAISSSVWAAQGGLASNPRIIQCMERAILEVQQGTEDRVALTHDDLAEIIGNTDELLGRKIPADAYRSLQHRWEKIDADLNRLPNGGAFAPPFHPEERFGLSKTIQGRKAPEKGSSALARRNWLKADQSVSDWAHRGIPLSIEKILELHRTITSGLFKDSSREGQFRNRAISVIGKPWKLYADPKVGSHMEDFLRWYGENERTLHPIELAALSYQRLVTLHPFWDANGRTTRLIMDWILESHGYPPTLIPKRLNDVAVYGTVVPQDNVTPTFALNAVTRGVEASIKAMKGSGSN